MQAIKSVLKISGVLVAVIAINMVGTANAAASSPDFALTANITLAGEYTQNDVVFVQENLAFLQKYLPTWYQYVTDAGALTLTIDEEEGAVGRAATAKCCDAQGRGVITFGFHFGQSPDDAGQTSEAQRVAFIGTFVQEVTHILDQRAGRHAKTNFKSCVAAEKSGLEKQLQVKRDLAGANVSGEFLQALNRQTRTEASALVSRDLWQQYCGAFEK